MFDDLHDPTPPSGDLAQLAAVAERAAARRRRRRAIGGSIAALSLLAVAVTAASLDRSGQEGQLVAVGDTDATTTMSTTPSATTMPSSTPIADPGITTTTPTATPPPASTVVGTSATSLPVSDPLPSAEDDRTLLGRDLPQCNGTTAERTCPTFGTLSDGTLLAVVDGLVIVFDQADSNFRIDFEAWQSDPRLIAVGPEDIGYVSWVPIGEPSDGVAARRVSAVEMTGPDAGRLVTTFDGSLDPEDELRPGLRGLVTTRCCVSRVLIDPVVAPTFPWVDAADNEVASTDVRFGIELTDDAMVITGVGNNAAQTWTRPLPEGIDVIPRIFEVADGSAVFVFNPLHSGGTRDVPIFLFPDGSVEVGAAVAGRIEHVLSDGRLIVLDADTSTFVVVDPHGADAIAEAPLAPLVAINAGGDAVYVPATSSSLTPVMIYDGPQLDELPDVGDGPNAVAHVSVAPDESVAYVGLCCSPIVGTVFETQLPEPTSVSSPPVYGSAPVFSPYGTFHARADADGAIAVTNTASGELLEVRRRAVAQWDTAWDQMWIDESRFAVLGSLGRTWTLSVFDIGAVGTNEPLVTVLFSRKFAGFGDSGFDTLRFAGRPIAGEIAVHEPGSDTVFSGTLDDFGNNNGDERGSSLASVELPGPAQSAWFFDPGQRIWVDAVGTLRVGDLTVPGEYTWARR